MFEDYPTCDFNDLINFWTRKFARNRFFRNEECRQMANEMYQCWVRAGLEFPEIFEDYLAHPGYCPKNKKSGKNWFELLNQGENISEYPPQALIMSTIKYFQSKGKI